MTQSLINPELVESLPIHAVEVTAKAHRGMDAVLEVMVKQVRGQ